MEILISYLEVDMRTGSGAEFTAVCATSENSPKPIFRSRSCHQPHDRDGLQLFAEGKGRWRKCGYTLASRKAANAIDKGNTVSFAAQAQGDHRLHPHSR
jgi:hypothetical protein